MDDHSPGPWHRVGNEVYYGMLNGKTVHQQIPREADARLIAAAPKMLRALRHSVPFLEQIVALGVVDGDDPSDRITLDMVQNAIAEATGERRQSEELLPSWPQSLQGLPSDVGKCLCDLHGISPDVVERLAILLWKCAQP